MKRLLGALLIGAVLLTGCVSSSTSSSQPAVTHEAAKPKDWNKKEIDATKNGNLQIAAAKLKEAGDTKAQAMAPVAGDVFKTPWNFYGQVVKITGEVAIVQDYAPESDEAKAFGGSDGVAEIVLVADDDTIVDFMVLGSSKSLRVQDTVTVYGYPVGQVQVDNKLGGKTDQLAVVGKEFDKQ